MTLKATRPDGSVLLDFNSENNKYFIDESIEASEKLCLMNELDVVTFELNQYKPLLIEFKTDQKHEFGNVTLDTAAIMAQFNEITDITRAFNNCKSSYKQIVQHIIDIAYGKTYIFNEPSVVCLEIKNSQGSNDKLLDMLDNYSNTLYTNLEITKKKKENPEQDIKPEYKLEKTTTNSNNIILFVNINDRLTNVLDNVVFQSKDFIGVISLKDVLENNSIRKTIEILDYSGKQVKKYLITSKQL